MSTAAQRRAARQRRAALSEAVELLLPALLVLLPVALLSLAFIASEIRHVF